MEAADKLEKCRERLESEYGKDHSGNRLADVIRGLEMEFGGDIGGALTKYAGYIEAAYKYVKCTETHKGGRKWQD